MDGRGYRMERWRGEEEMRKNFLASFRRGRNWRKGDGKEMRTSGNCAESFGPSSNLVESRLLGCLSNHSAADRATPLTVWATDLAARLCSKLQGDASIFQEGLFQQRLSSVLQRNSLSLLAFVNSSTPASSRCFQAPKCHGAPHVTLPSGVRPRLCRLSSVIRMDTPGSPCHCGLPCMSKRRHRYYVSVCWI